MEWNCLQWMSYDKKIGIKWGGFLQLKISCLIKMYELVLYYMYDQSRTEVIIHPGQILLKAPSRPPLTHPKLLIYQTIYYLYTYTYILVYQNCRYTTKRGISDETSIFVLFVFITQNVIYTCSLYVKQVYFRALTAAKSPINHEKSIHWFNILLSFAKYFWI